MRVQADELLRQRQQILAIPHVAQILDAMPNFVSMLNRQRQMVFANRVLRDFLGLEDKAALPGVRMGEALSCRFSYENKDGCGESAHCTMCGANQAIRTALKGKSCTKECAVSVEGPAGVSSLNFLVTVHPIELGGSPFVIFTAVDIESQKLKRSLENVFFREVLTLASGIRGIALSLNEQAPPSLDNITESLYLAADSLVDEIESQKALLAAEAKELKVNPKEMRTLWLLQKIRENYAWSLAAEGKGLKIDPDTLDEPLCSDPAILKRALVNLVKNALDDTLTGKTVWMGCRAKGDKLEFWVKNQAVMPKEVQLQIFKRFFSTKSKSAGTGTYGTRILVNNYLKGEVDFTSEPGFGTEFRIRIPKTIQPASLTRGPGQAHA